MTTADVGFDADLPDRFAGPYAPASARELKRLIKDWRTGRATRHLLEAISDAYVVVIGALMIGAMIVNVVLQAQRVVSQCETGSCVSARTILPWAALAASVAAALAISRLFGPVLASAAEGFWLMDGPVRRSQLLRGRLVSAVVIAFVLGGVLGGLVSALSGSSVAAVLVWIGCTGVAAAAAVGFAATQQAAEHTLPTKIAGALFWLVALASLIGVIGVSAGWFTLGITEQVDEYVGVYVLVGAAGILLIALVVAGARLNAIRRVRLVSGGSLVSSLQGAFFALDIGLARDIVVERRALEIGHVRSRRGRGTGVESLVWRELQRLVRFPQPLLGVAATVVVPYAAVALGMSVLAPVFSALALFAALIPMLNGLRVLTRTGGLARCLPFSVSQIKIASIIVPAVVAVLWSMAVTAAFATSERPVPEASVVALLTAVAGLLGAVRWTQAKAVDFGAPMVSTQAGAFPPGLMTNLFRGFDVCLLVTAPLLLGVSPIWSFAIALIAAIILLGSFNAEDMRAKQAEQQKELAAARANRR